MLKVVRVTVEYDDPLVICHFKGGAPHVEHVLSLDRFDVQHGSLRWAFKDDRGVYIEGGIGEVPWPAYPDAWIAASIPVKLHRRQGRLAPEFVVRIPTSRQAHSLSYLRRKYGDAIGQ